MATNNVVNLNVATQAQQEAGSATGAYVAPGVQQYHPSAAKVWAFVTMSGSTPTLQTSFNVTSITDTAVGRITFNFTVAFSSVNYCAIPAPEIFGTVVNNLTYVNIKSVGSCEVDHLETSLTDPTEWSVAAWGDQ